MNWDKKTRRSIGFGLGKLHHVFSAAERERIVLGACDAGITHFDMAPAYGDGLCEAEVGRILVRRRDSVTLATKVGIPAGNLGGRSVPLYFASKLLRKAFARRYGDEYRRRDFSPATLRQSIDQSLRRLRTDRVDILFFHEPRGLVDVGQVHEAVSTMERLREQGKVLHYGISSRSDLLLEIVGAGCVGDVAQFELSQESPALMQRLQAVRTSAFGLIRFLKPRGGKRLDFEQVLRGFFAQYPTTMPILASNRPEEIAKLGKAPEWIA